MNHISNTQTEIELENVAWIANENNTVNDTSSAPVSTPVNTKTKSTPKTETCLAEISRVNSYLVKPRDYERVHIEFMLLDGPNTGECEAKYYNITSQNVVNLLKAEFKKIGVIVKSPDDLESACAAIMGKRVMITIEHREDGYRNVYIAGEVKSEEEKVDRELIWS